METILKFLRSPIGRKVMMALTGLLLVGFLVTHLAANLLILKDANEYNAYSHMLTSSWLIIPAELGLVFLFGYHAINGVVIAYRNHKARPEKYLAARDAGGASRRSLLSRVMPFTGLVLFLFLIFHVATMKFGVGFDGFFSHNVRDLHGEVIDKFTQPAWAITYAAMMILLGAHLWHGLGAVWMSIGIRHSKGLQRMGQGLAILITGGFLIIPLAVLGGAAADRKAPVHQQREPAVERPADAPLGDQSVDAANGAPNNPRSTP